MMKKYLQKFLSIGHLVLPIVIMFGSFAALAQETVKVTGTVSDVNNDLLPGVSVLIKGTTKGTQTDVNGRYSISAASGSTLVFTFLGFEAQEARVDNQTTINIQLKSESRSLQEVVVSYGTQRRREVTGSIAQVNASELQDMPVVQFSQQLQGKVAGVQVSQFTTIVLAMGCWTPWQKRWK